MKIDFEINRILTNKLLFIKNNRDLRILDNFKKVKENNKNDKTHFCRNIFNKENFKLKLKNEIQNNKLDTKFKSNTFFNKNINFNNFSFKSLIDKKIEYSYCNSSFLVKDVL